jgi:DNA helicase-2/ATP-dependent DNA helicase PcrA
MAVLYRTRFCSLSFEQAFRSQGIPYQMLGGRGFFERREILDLNCYLTAAVFPRDDAAFERIINVPKRGIGPGTVKKINALRSKKMNLQTAARKALGEKILTPKIYEGVKSVITLLDEIRKMKPDRALQEVIRRTDYEDYMKGYSTGESDYVSRQENVEQLIYAASLHESIAEYLEEAALVREDKDEEEEKSAVNLSTVHASKGLEFQVVFVAACEEQLFPHWRSLEKQSDLEEERRLMYVSMTRSEKYLFLSHAQMRKGQFNRKSRFIKEVEKAMA